MTLADRLRQLAAALPASGAVMLTRADLEELLRAEAAPASSDAPAGVDLTAEQVATQMARAVSTVRTWCADGRLPGAYRLHGREWRIPPGAVAAMQAAEAERYRAAREPRQVKPAAELDLGAWRRVTRGDGG